MSQFCEKTIFFLKSKQILLIKTKDAYTYGILRVAWDCYNTLDSVKGA